MLSARNQLKGTVARVNRGTAVCSVTVELDGGQEIVSTITVESFDRMGLSIGSPVAAVVKASNVILATEP
ncbi:MAG: TOBE domain-containing protein [Actinomycetota bacterium]|nr:TOBE domain-containing protein [Actinomycetota bacterium]